MQVEVKFSARKALVVIVKSEDAVVVLKRVKLLIGASIRLHLLKLPL